MVQMKTAPGGHRRPIHLDSMVEVPGGVVGTDPYRRWGPTVRWAVIILESPVMLVPHWRPLDKRDVVITDASRTQEFYREGPFSSRAADNKKSAIVAIIKADGLDQFLRRMQIEQSTIGPVYAPSGKVSGLQQAWASLGLLRESFRNHRHDDRQD
jgi:hypothetical protein